MDHKIVGGASAGHRLDVLQPLVAEASIDRIHHRRLGILDEIAVVGHAQRNHVLTLEKVDIMVVHAYVKNIFCYRHIHFFAPLPSL